MRADVLFVRLFARLIVYLHKKIPMVTGIIITISFIMPGYRFDQLV